MSDLSFVIVGHVDHGKSTLLGRLLADTDSLPDERIAQVKAQCEAQGKGFEYAFLLDAFEEEQKQGITIDTTKIEFSTHKRTYTIIDAPGHVEFVKNMVSGAARAQAAVLIIDAKEGVQEQTRRHALMLSLLGIEQVAVVVNKMDLVSYEQEAFERICDDARSYLSRLDMHPDAYIPMAAKSGENVLEPSGNMAWHTGPTFIEMIDAFKTIPEPEGPLRMPIQDVYKFDERRIIAGRVESGTLHEGQEVVISPQGHTSTIKSIESDADSAGHCVGVTLDDEYYLERGDVISAADDVPGMSTLLRCNVFWLGSEPLRTGKTYRLRIHTQEVSCEVHTIDEVIDAKTLSDADKDMLDRNDVGTIILKMRQPVVFDPYSSIPRMGRFVLVDGNVVCGGGIITTQVQALRSRSTVETRSELASPKESSIAREERERRHGHTGKVIWLTGLPGCGKSDIAKRLERTLWDHNKEVYYLNASTLRFTLTSDLGFSKEERQEQARRMAEVANMLAMAGFIVIVSIVSPYKSDRESAREIVGKERFIEVFVDMPLEICKQNNPHGIYTKAESGEIKNVPGVHFDYEKAAYPVLTLHIGSKEFDMDEKVSAVMEVLDV